MKISNAQYFTPALRKERAASAEAARDLIRAAEHNDVDALYSSFERLQYDCWGGWRKIARLAKKAHVHEDFRTTFLAAWLGNGDSLRSSINGDLVLIEVLRAFLPPYDGDQPVMLYRGDSRRNRARRTYGLSWSSDRMAARCFAQNMSRNYEGGSILLEALVPAAAIICAPALITEAYKAEEEFLVDRRKIAAVRVIEHFE